MVAQLFDTVLDLKQRLISSHPFLGFLARLKNNFNKDYAGLIAAGIAFYFLMACFPAMAAAISLYGIFADPSFIMDKIDDLSSFLPADTLKLLSQEADRFMESETTLGFGLALSIGLTIYSASRGVRALIQGFNIAYNLHESRNIISFSITSFMLTLVMLLYFMTSLAAVALIPFFLNIMHLEGYAGPLLAWVRWPLLYLIGVIGLQILYHYGPAYERVPRWRWFSWGACIAGLLWLGIGSMFSMYVTNFGSYNEVYGSLGAVVILLLWFWFSAMLILLGAEINGTLQRAGLRKNPI